MVDHGRNYCNHKHESYFFYQKSHKKIFSIPFEINLNIQCDSAGLRENDKLFLVFVEDSSK